MKRLYFITQSLDSAEKISDDVHNMGVKDWNFHVMSRNEAGLYKRHIHSSNIYHDNNILRQAERGGLIGAFVGASMVLVSNFSPSIDFSIFSTLGVIVFLMFIGSWFGGFLGIHQESYKVAKFHDALDLGKFLVMIDVSAKNMHLIEDMMIEKHSEAQHGGVGSTLILPF
ncbi:MAG: hypothetical protein HRT35_27930 [Algicola sp.]|nr:hypothetical protein [Algicola sp.]